MKKWSGYNQLSSQRFFCIWKAVWYLFLHMKIGLNIVNAIQQWLTKHGHSAAWSTSHLPLTEIWMQASINLHPLFWVLVVGKNTSVCTVNSLNFAAGVNNSIWSVILSRLQSYIPLPFTDFIELFWSILLPSSATVGCQVFLTVVSHLLDNLGQVIMEDWSIYKTLEQTLVTFECEQITEWNVSPHCYDGQGLGFLSIRAGSKK
jgi:hypothetical protein